MNWVEEHFAASDKGIALLRRFLVQQLRRVADGGDPAGVAFDEQSAYVQFEAGNYLADCAAAP